MIVKVESSNVKLLLGEDWMAKQEAKVKKYVSNFERVVEAAVLIFIVLVAESKYK